MKALIVWNDSDLDTDEIDEINADYFYCLFNQKGLFGENEDHIFIENLRASTAKYFKESLKRKGINEVVFWGETFPKNDVERFFGARHQIYSICKTRISDYLFRSQFIKGGDHENTYSNHSYYFID